MEFLRYNRYINIGKMVSQYLKLTLVLIADGLSISNSSPLFSGYSISGLISSHIGLAIGSYISSLFKMRIIGFKSKNSSPIISHIYKPLYNSLCSYILHCQLLHFLKAKLKILISILIFLL